MRWLVNVALPQFLMTVFRVDAGNCIFIRTPSKHYCMVDCGSRADWSPGRHISESRYDGFTPPLANLIITHLHEDHFTDIENVDHYLQPRILSRPAIADLDLSDGTSATAHFIGMHRRYTQPVQRRDYGLTYAEYQVPAEHQDGNPNNASLVTFWQYMGTGVCLPGDLEPYGWLWLIENAQFFRDCFSFGYWAPGVARHLC